MCGISGIINFNNQKVQELELLSMVQAMKHRGPDDQGIFIDNTVGFGFVRLSIIDLSSAGHQPFQSEDQRYTMVFNGEIYNYVELREELIRNGTVFNTKTDTEVLLKSYIKWGKDCLHKFNGMWAFAIYDNQEKTVFFARDRFGVKPFYYYSDENNFYFASEIPSILAVLKAKPKANEQAIFDYLVFNKTEHNSQTFFEGIEKISHGHCLFVDLKKQKNTIAPEKWYDLRENVKKSTGFSSPNEFKDVFVEAVKLRLRSDVPVGVCLSGGLDSSSIVSVIIDHLNVANLNTFSAVFDNNFSGDESKFILEYADKPGQRHYITPTAETLYDDLDDFITCHTEPIPSTSPYAQYKVMQKAQNNVVVTIDGQGADEHLAGYHYIFGFYFKDLLINLKWYTLLKEMYYYLKIHKSTFGLKTFLFFLLPKNIRTKTKVNDLGYFNVKFVNDYLKKSSISDNLYGSKSLKDSLLNHFEYKLEHLLKWGDRNSMHFSIESRVPFLDYKLVEKSLATKSNEIIKNGMTKSILRKSMKGILPEVIRNRVDKIGFETPQDEWFREIKWQNKINNIITSESFGNRGIFDQKNVVKKYKKHISREINISNEIWKWVHLELWFRKYIDEL
ncbi:asparagine synthase (glutamine-hydrolyzing) [Flavobacterium branchiophilum]|uniref:asparagine synthase (glutamine-hydrolyzing) n=1 Tax=Flavobacterium branchiophilum (strain FL-15) TaxID=1034807 RepID=G2Z7L5_FLABF|nr:asparagine synthase (glutamine-hydrolyzing) [Flavobacterium branchiophilum]CCB69133.1 Asparagine synthetase [glutamine-hydrolyzing] AsnB2 [Flavobacterium branchiophilum FL-15]